MNILHVDCSPRKDSHSRQLSAAIIERFLAALPRATVTRRDLGTTPLPHHSPEYANALSSPAMAAAAISSDVMDLSELVIGEVERSDIVVIGTPMNNFTVPSVLKAWIDQLLRVGRTIRPTPTGKVGTLDDRPVFIAIASGGVFTGVGADQPDFLTPYLSAALGCIGLKKLQYLPVQATAFLEADQAALARQDTLAALDMSMITEIRDASLGALRV